MPAFIHAFRHEFIQVCLHLGMRVFLHSGIQVCLPTHNIDCMPALWQENVGFGGSLHFFSDKSGVAIPFLIYSIYRNSIDYSEFNRETEKTLKEHSAIRFSRDLKIMFLS